jgi:hypothetical protein
VTRRRTVLEIFASGAFSSALSRGTTVLTTNPSKSISEANLGLRLIFSDSESLAITGARTLLSWANVAESMANGSLVCLAKINEMRGRFYAVAKAPSCQER